MPLQPKLAVNQPGDAYELEADRVAEQVMCMPEPAVQRCGAGCGCETCQQLDDDLLHTKAIGQASSGTREAPAIVHDVLRSAGRPLETEVRAFMEPRFGRDFGDVRVHVNALAAQSARAVDARAYTVGQHVVFGPGQYVPHSSAGRQLLAHELTHVAQQQEADLSSATSLSLADPQGGAEQDAQRIGATSGGSTASARAGRSPSEPMVARASPQAVGYVMTLGTTAGSGIQFWPTNVTDTQVGPVSVQGGLLSSGASRLNVILGENLTLRTLARQLLPLWTTATPFTPPGAAAPLPLHIITEDELAQGLLVYNQTYLPVPAMTNWRSGLRFPLPAEIDEATGMTTLHPLQIRALTGAFDPAWTPLLDLRVRATAPPPAAALQADVAAFLAREPTALARGIHLGARAVTNAIAELPFIRETFRQLGAGAFDVALVFMDNLVNREIELLAAQRDGAVILAEIRTALGVGPGVLAADQQASLTKANNMLGRVAGVVAVAPPTAARARAEKTVAIDTVKLDGSTHTPATDVAVANGILAQCNVRLAHGVDATATAAETTTWLGGNTDLSTSPACGSSTVEERALFQGASASFGLTARLRAFYPATFSGSGANGYSIPPFCATGTAAALRGMAVLQNAAGVEDLAHEVGHILLNSGTHPAATLMSPFTGRAAVQLTGPQCTTIYNNA